MAHRLTPAEIDQVAAEEAANTPVPPVAPSFPTLAYGATGEDVTKLVNVLGLLGYATSDVAQGAPPVLNESVLGDVRAAQHALGVIEPAQDVQGELVGPVTFTAVYQAAEDRLAPQETQAA